MPLYAPYPLSPNRVEAVNPKESKIPEKKKSILLSDLRFIALEAISVHLALIVCFEMTEANEMDFVL